MGDRDSNNWVPIVAGVVVGAGILTLLYKMFFSGNGSLGSKKKSGKTTGRVNQQINATFRCTCKKGGPDPFFSCEEKKRKERERARKAAERAAAGLPDVDDSAYHGGGVGGVGGGGGAPPPRFSPLQVFLGSTGFMFALFAMLLKFGFMENETTRAFLNKIGLGHLLPPPRKKKRFCVVSGATRKPKPPPEIKPKDGC